MRRYWKNMYGFRLQQDEKAEGEEEQPPFYVNVTFDFGSSNRHASQPDRVASTNLIRPWLLQEPPGVLLPRLVRAAGRAAPGAASRPDSHSRKVSKGPH